MFISWVFWGAFLVSAAGLTMIQIPWCCRQNAAFVYGSVAVSVLSSLSSIGVGVYALVVFPNKIDCYPWVFDHWGDREEHPDYTVWCKYKVWAVIAFVCAAIWMLVAGLLWYFVASGRHGLWEEHHSTVGVTGDNGNNNDNAAVAVELGSAPAIDTAVAVAAPAVPVKEDVTD